MSTPPPGDQAHARFRRGGSSAPAGQAAPPPPTVPGYGVSAPAQQPWAPEQKPTEPAQQQWAPEQQGSSAEQLWGPAPQPERERPQYGELVETGVESGVPAVPQTTVVNGYGQPGPGQYPFGPAAPLYETPSYDWMPVEADPGRGSGIASISVGVFFGLVGLFIGIHSVRRSRSVGLKGAVGIVGIIVSCLSMLLFGSIIGSWIKYEVDLSAQCAQVGDGQFYTSSGHLVTCPA